MTQRLATRRMMKELTDIQTKGCPDGIEALDVSGMDTWVFSIAVLGEETVYRGEKFALKMTFPERYPIECPIVTFVCNERFQPPLHPHVYSNGHICASIFGNDWSPVLTAISVCITIQSMLASNKKRARRKRSLCPECTFKSKGHAVGVRRRYRMTDRMGPDRPTMEGV